ncbi:MAG: hypothetical protein WCF90_06750 [Methanomicrobiales archaeon]
MRLTGKETEAVSMHPQDFRAHLAWVTARRAKDAVLEKTLQLSR